MRVLAFITALTREPRFLNVLGKYGYDEAENEEGWNRLRETAMVSRSADNDPAYLAAMEEIDAADEGIFKVVSATLLRRFPKEGAVILEGLSASTGAGAVMNMDLLLQRLDALETSGADDATRERNALILSTLARRGFDKAERARLAELIAKAKKAKPNPKKAIDEADRDRVYVEKLVALRDWYLEWADIARGYITRRDDLIRLGLGRRASGGGVEEEEEPTPGPVPAPIPAPAPAPAPTPAPVPTDDPFRS